MKTLNKIVTIIIVTLFISMVASCDFSKCDLTIINNTNQDLYFYTHPLHGEGKYPYNFAIKENYSSDTTKSKYYYEFEPNSHALPRNDTVEDCIVNTSFRQFAKEYGGLTIVSYLRDTVETKSKDYLFLKSDLFRKLDLTYSDLEKASFIVEIN